MKHNKCISLLFAAALLTTACSDDEINYGPAGVLIEAPTAAETTATAATLSSTFDLRSGLRYTTAGFCYSVNPAPTIYNSAVKATVKNDTLTATLTGLAPQTTYYVRAFVSVYEGEMAYSSEVALTTQEGTVEELLAAYKAPTYPDYYVSLSDWNDRARWNLANVHDPSVVKAEDGYYYMYQTDASYGNAHDGHGHFHARRSLNLVDWEYLGATMQEAPAWIKEKLNEYRAAQGLHPIDNPSYAYWAPVVRKVKDGLYRMYYSIVVNHFIQSGAVSLDENFDNSWTERSFIGMMETTDPASNEWTDKGMVLCSSSDWGNDWARPALNDWNAYFKWNAIDPAYVVTANGEHWLVYGSWHSGIAAVQVNGETGKPLNALGNPWGTAEDIAAYGRLIATRHMGNRWQASEGPEIVYRDGYYYLFLAYDAVDVSYNTRVVRSQNITGPYVGMDGTNVTANGGNTLPVVTHPYKFSGSDGWVGISHCAVFDDGNGNWFFASQGRLPHGVQGNEFSNSNMLGHVRSIRWNKDGWPLVMPERYGAVPQVPITEEELVGDWEHIDLSYSYGNQKESSVMTLAADHKIIAGSWADASWSYDAENQILTANGVELYLQREVDWEASPRKHTIVYAGYGSNHKTYWGKKVK